MVKLTKTQRKLVNSLVAEYESSIAPLPHSPDLRNLLSRTYDSVSYKTVRSLIEKKAAKFATLRVNEKNKVFYCYLTWDLTKIARFFSHPEYLIGNPPKEVPLFSNKVVIKRAPVIFIEYPEGGYKIQLFWHCSVCDKGDLLFEYFHNQGNFSRRDFVKCKKCKKDFKTFFQTFPFESPSLEICPAYPYEKDIYRF